MDVDKILAGLKQQKPICITNTLFTHRLVLLVT